MNKLTARTAEFIRNALHEISDEELQRAYIEAESLTETNCGWLEYRLANAVTKAIGAHRGFRERFGDGWREQLELIK